MKKNLHCFVKVKDSLYGRIRWLRDKLVLKADQIVQWVLTEADLEVERISAMASVTARKLHRKLSFWTWSTLAMAVARGSMC